MRYAVQYQLSDTHTGRIHDTLEAARRDLEACERAAHAGGDSQSIGIVEIDEDGDERTMPMDEVYA